MPTGFLALSSVSTLKANFPEPESDWPPFAESFNATAANCGPSLSLATGRLFPSSSKPPISRVRALADPLISWSKGGRNASGPAARAAHPPREMGGAVLRCSTREKEKVARRGPRRCELRSRKERSGVKRTHSAVPWFRRSCRSEPGPQDSGPVTSETRLKPENWRCVTDERLRAEAAPVG